MESLHAERPAGAMTKLLADLEATVVLTFTPNFAIACVPDPIREPRALKMFRRKYLGGAG
jgi:hypothetical protein